ncbi:MAG: DUF2232 domain-containing protein [Gemmatimonadetes bacterium]|nr:DUF2232 domain-containing protein [Gemmatimonadota bacterium]
MSERRRSFWRAVALGALAMLFSPLSTTPLGPLVLIGIPAAIALLAFQRHRLGSVLLAGALVLVAALGGAAPTGLWYIERGWAVLLAGGFVVATALAPDRSTIARSMLALTIAIAATLSLAVLRPQAFAEIDWRITGQFDRVIALFDLSGEAGAAIAEAMRQVATIAKLLYPALLALASLAALGCATYIVRRAAGQEAPLGPMRQFRFSDHLVWALVLGLVLIVLPVGVWAVRAGGNLVTVMGGLYVLRGAAVLVWLGTSVISSAWSIALWIIAALLFYPITVGTALVMGLSDTWLDLRSRLGVEPESE